LADPEFDFSSAYARYAKGYSINTETTASVRGSRSGELAARCMVEIGTSSYYTALGNFVNEPLLKAVCRNIATDEFRHYNMFYTHLQRYVARDKVSRLQRFKTLLDRMMETEDDELAYAYYTANAPDGAIYVREDCARAYEARAFPLYTQEIVRHSVALMLKACGFKPYSFGNNLASPVAWWFLQRKNRQANAFES
jgi:hypothetical protein